MKLRKQIMFVTSNWLALSAVSISSSDSAFFGMKNTPLIEILIFPIKNIDFKIQILLSPLPFDKYHFV